MWGLLLLVRTKSHVPIQTLICRLIVQSNLFNTIPVVRRTYRNTNGIVISRVTCRVNKQEKRGFNT